MLFKFADERGILIFNGIAGAGEHENEKPGAFNVSEEPGPETLPRMRAFDEAGISHLVVQNESGAVVDAAITGGTPEGADSDQFVSIGIESLHPIPIQATSMPLKSVR